MMQVHFTRAARLLRFRQAALGLLAAAAVALLATHAPAQELFPPAKPGPLAPRIPRDTLVTTGRDDHATLLFYGLRATEKGDEAQQVAPAVQAAMKREARLDAALSPGDGQQDGGVRQIGTLGDATLNSAAGESALWPRDCYAIDLPECDARFLFIDTRMLLAKEPSDADETRARRMLEQADSAFVVPRRFRFIMLEQPLFGSGLFEKNWASADPASFAGRNRAEILTLCERRRVTAVIASGDRLYQRLWVKNLSGGGFWHITSGGAGRTLDDFRLAARDQGLALPIPHGQVVPPATVRTERVAHYCRIELPRKVGGTYVNTRFDVYRVKSKKKAELLEHLDLEHGP